ncbi:CobW family GTP-binding protein [Mammaliicoccus lentus]|uniref:CobW family GTP-binding protein n=1 Tax=Mammaliicoccus lentus TaxID=42858 RepID=UPI0011CBBCD5|nr:GTP-binding protein [Mammaliicoccus lentus]
MEIVIITGFLGSGKTTMLNSLINDVQQENKKSAVIMNEFGKRSIDTELIQSDVPISEMINGCICCVMKEDVATQLHQVYLEYQPDVVFIECSVIAHPLEVLDACLTPVLAPFSTIRTIIGIVDLPAYQHLSSYTEQTQQLIDIQLKYCHDIVLNKIDMMDTDDAINTMKSIQEDYTEADIFSTTFGNIHFSHFTKSNRDLKVTQHDAHHHGHVFHKYYPLTEPIMMEGFKTWLKDLPNNIYRIKGFITFKNDPNKYLIQVSNDNLRIEQYNINIDDYLILIGDNLNKEAVFSPNEIKKASHQSK